MKKTEVKADIKVTKTSSKTIRLSRSDVNKIVIAWLANETDISGDKVHISHEMKDEYDDCDPLGRYPPATVYDGVTVTVTTVTEE